MKKIWLAVAALITLMLSIYAIYAGITVNGVEIYLVSYDAGRIFSATYVVAGILAFAGWIWVGIYVTKIVRQWWNADGKKAESETEMQDRTLEQKPEIPDVKEAGESKEQKSGQKERICEGCGAVLAANAKFCTQCGKKVE